MNKNTKRIGSIAILLSATPLYAASLSEIEANHPINSSQYITETSTAMDISGVIGSLSSTTTTTTTTTTSTTTQLRGSLPLPTAPVPAPAPVAEPDLDYYSFYANAGDVVTIDIDNGMGGAKSVDTILGIFDSGYTLQRMNDDASSTDEGSSSTRDARIDNFKIPKSGVYYVGVSAYPRYFADGGDVTAESTAKGDYKLVITGVTPPLKQINIDIKPGGSANAPINPKSNGKLPVALLSDSGFNAMEIDPATLTFGARGTEASLSKCNPSGQDVNGDGLLDMICHFENQAAGFGYDSLEGIARGKSRSGIAFEGRGLLKVVPTKTK